MGRYHLGVLGVHLRILKWILKKQVTAGGLDLCGSQAPVAGSCKHGNEFVGSIKRDEFVDLLSPFQGVSLLG